jgi:hypothetical protein
VGSWRPCAAEPKRALHTIYTLGVAFAFDSGTLDAALGLCAQICLAANFQRFAALKMMTIIDDGVFGGWSGGSDGESMSDNHS